MQPKKRIALVAHDNRKKDLVQWAEENWQILTRHHLVCTGTTGKLIDEALRNKLGDQAYKLDLHRLKSGPLGGDLQLGAMISDKKVDIFIFFWDPMTAQPHDVDVKALLRISVLYNIPTASNRSSADFLIASKWFEDDYVPSLPDLDGYTQRSLPTE